MDERKIRRETERVVKRVLKRVGRSETTGKKEFEAILNTVIEQVHRKTGLSSEAIGKKTDTVLRDLPHEYGQLPVEARSWEALIAYLYTKYLRELGVLELS